MDEINERIDARGLPCPMPIVKLAQAISGMQIGQRVEIIASDQSFAPDVEAWCRKTGHNLINIEEGDEEIKAYVEKTK